MTELLDKLLAGEGLASVLVTLLIAIVGGLWQLYKYFSDRTAMRKHRTAVDREFPEPNYRQRRQILCDELRDHLDRIDSETNWSHRQFVPLDAEVEVLKGDRKRRQVMDLFAGIRTNRRSRLFLIMGDPGSGKSVALRKLCRDLLREVNLTGKIPIYVNLKEWSDGTAWTRQRPPTEAELQKFLFENVRTRVSHRSRAFLDTYFKRMLDDGRFFLVLDSFDEIPRVMDVGEASWLIKELSQILTRVLVGGDKGRGVVASRYFRRPRFTREDVTVLEIRPLNDLKIATAIDRATEHADTIKRALFGERPDLAPLARNPFALGLIVDFCEANPRQLPKTQAELYENFVAHSFKFAEEEMRERNLDRRDVLSCASSIAFEMFGSDQHGLEMPMATLKEHLPNMPVDAVVDFLVAAHIGRRGAKGTAFSFSHRRFNEYFLIENFRESPDTLPLESIATDGRWRDALVLFAEVAEEPVAKSMALFCWGEILQSRGSAAEISGDRYLRGLHSLRFLATAFRGRREILAEFEAELAALTNKAIVSGDDILVAKHALEAAGVLSDQSAEHAISAALASRNPWLVENAFRACRYLAALPRTTKVLIIDHLLRIPPIAHMRTYAETMLSLRMAESLKIVRTTYQVRHLDILLSLAALIIIIVFPMCILLLLSFSIVIASGAILTWLGVPQRWPFNDLLSSMHLASLIMLYFIIANLIVNGPVDQSAYTVIYTIYRSWNHELGLVIGEKNTGFIYLCILAIVAVRPINVILRAARFAAVDIDIAKGWLVVVLMVVVAIALSRIGEYVRIRISATGIMSGIGEYMDSVCGMIFGCEYIWHGITYIWHGITYILLGIIILGFSLVFGLLVVSVLTRILNHISGIFSDARVLAQAKREFRGTRGEIDLVFSKVRTSAYRLKYARWLETHSTPFRDVLAGTENRWPGGQRPNFSDPGSILLAQLDERWLGLDR